MTSLSSRLGRLSCLTLVGILAGCGTVSAGSSAGTATVPSDFLSLPTPSTSPSEATTSSEQSKTELQDALDNPAARDPNPSAEKTFLSPSFPARSEEPFPQKLMAQDAQAPASRYIFACTGHWQGIVSDKRIIAYVGESGQDAMGSSPEVGLGEMLIQVFNDFNEPIDSEWLRFPGTGQIRYLTVDGDVAILVPQTGQPFQVNLADAVAGLA